MTTSFDASRYQHALERWRALAESRLEHMSMLYETGRWRRYFSEEKFLAIIRETTAAAEVWRKIAPDPQPDWWQTIVPEQAPAAASLATAGLLGPADMAEVIELAAEPAFVRTQPPPSPFAAEAQRSVA